MELDAHGLLAPGAAAAVDVEGGVWKGLKLAVEGGATVPLALELTQGSKVTSALSVVEFNVRRSLMPGDEEGYVRENATCMHVENRRSMDGTSIHADRGMRRACMQDGITDSQQLWMKFVLVRVWRSPRFSLESA